MCKAAFQEELTFEQLAATVGISASYMQQVESGQCVPSPRILNAIDSIKDY
ncbi:helix-turn-helix transcriptional regulator [Candidatus Woesearchaeota archaeon]|nr:helix-turn-helix transcriptional regulator [Candidatus Woesearchaeota archaeon]